MSAAGLPANVGMILDHAKSKELPKSEVARDLVALISQTNWSDAEAAAIYTAALNKCRSKTCFFCGKLKVSVGGESLWHDGDMSKPKVFKCSDCKEKG